MIMWNILIIATVTDSRRKTWDPTRLDFIVKRMPRSNRITLKSKVSWTTVTRNMHLSAGTREPLLHVFLSSVHTTHREQMPLTRKEGEKKKKKSKFPTDLWPGAQRGCPACIQRRFKQSLWLHYLPSSSSPLHPSVDTRSHHTGADRPGITHSLAS